VDNIGGKGPDGKTIVHERDGSSNFVGIMCSLDSVNSPQTSCKLALCIHTVVSTFSAKIKYLWHIRVPISCPQHLAIQANQMPHIVKSNSVVPISVFTSPIHPRKPAP
jgi:hypothetical protein